MPERSGNEVELSAGRPQARIDGDAMDLCAVSDTCESIRHRVVTTPDMYGAPYRPPICY